MDDSRHEIGSEEPTKLLEKALSDAEAEVSRTREVLKGFQAEVRNTSK